MAASFCQVAKQAFILVLRSLAAVYSLRLELNRTSADTAVLAAFRRVAQKAHPDKGGTSEHQQRLNDAKKMWLEAKSNPGKAGRPKETTGAPLRQLALAGQERQAYRINGTATMLTFQGFPGVAAWLPFVVWCG
jgi:hypothetical protein